MIKKYRKKPVVIEAVEWTGSNTFEVTTFINVGTGKENAIELHKGKIIIPTLEGRMEARLGDFIIKGVQGEYYPCKPDIFKETYEEV